LDKLFDKIKLISAEISVESEDAMNKLEKICISFENAKGIVDMINQKSNTKKKNEWMKHIPNPFSQSQLSKDFWSLPKPINTIFIEEFKIHNWHKKWLKNYVTNMKKRKLKNNKPKKIKVN
jgi:hypothetical protein